MPSYEERTIVGKQIVITGATNGIGKEIARAMARRGANLTLVARSESKAQDTLVELAAEPGAVGRLDYVLADLADLSSVRTAAARIVADTSQIDILFDNAGVHSFEAGITRDGYELMAGTNHLGPFLLTHLLLDPLIAAAPSRIVVTASEAHRAAARLRPEDFAEPLRHSAIGSQPIYGRSKLLNILFTEELAQRLAGTGVTVNSFCPGAVASGLIRSSRVISAAARTLSHTPFVRTPEQGAQMGIRLALDPSLTETTGQFYTSTPGLRFLPAVPARRDKSLRTSTFDRTAELVGLG
ncbi:SDR family NAD(P)-dependent oxidoreductase [Nocardia sp. NPDC020380]|uniref:SDR family NAD(P)-dependent oxidoreductase n=1 Tax=Nocardia sp. NPDC020380 TaxID=3364309 RepID=UPI0037A3B10B